MQVVNKILHNTFCMLCLLLYTYTVSRTYMYVCKVYAIGNRGDTLGYNVKVVPLYDSSSQAP